MGHGEWCWLRRVLTTFYHHRNMAGLSFHSTHLHCLMCICSYNQCLKINVSLVHTRVAGSGFHLPFALHTPLIFPAGTNPGLHLKNISVPSSVSWYASMEPLPGITGCPQLTGKSNTKCTSNPLFRWGNKTKQLYVTIFLHHHHLARMYFIQPSLRSTSFQEINATLKE